MSTAERDKWEAAYRGKSLPVRAYPTPLLARFIDRLPGGRALDVACGRGRNAIYLARRGYAVDAVDVSAAALAEAAGTAAAAGVRVNWIEADLDGYAVPEATYAVIVVACYLNRALFPALAAALLPGGHLVVHHHLHTPRAVDGPRDPAFRLQPNELLDLAAGLRVLHYDEGVTVEANGRSMAHASLAAVNGDPGF